MHLNRGWSIHRHQIPCSSYEGRQILLLPLFERGTHKRRLDPLGKLLEGILQQWPAFSPTARSLEVPGHKIWRWFSDDVHNKIYEQSLEQFWVYKLWHRSRTCSGSLYRLLGEVNAIPVNVSPLTVREVLPGVVAKVGVSPRLQTSPPPQTSFLEYLALLGGKWMWDYVLDMSVDTTWIRAGLLSGSLVLLTDGLHQPKTDPTVSAAGWMIACTSVARHVKGSFYKCSSSACSY
jgi:hypothetical protein